MDSKERTPFIVKAITYFANIIILNLLFLLCSLPIVTYGAAYSALFTMTRELNSGETVVVKGYFRAFREQFRQSTMSWAVMFFPGLFLNAQAALLQQVNMDVPDVLYVCLLIPAIVYCGVLPWTLIQSSYFSCTLKQNMKNAVLLAVQLLPQTIILAAAQVLPAILFLFRIVDFLRMWPLWLFVYFAAVHAVAEYLLKLPMSSLVNSLREDHSKDEGDV